MATLIKEFGLRSSVLISVASIAMAVALGTVANYLFQLFALL